MTTDDPTLRPTSFDTYVGQASLIANLRDAVIAAKRGGWTMDHMLFAGPAGLGKTSIAAVVAAELGAKLRVTSAPAIEHPGQLASLLASLEHGDVLFIDEIHRMPIAVAEMLYSAMEDWKVDLFAGKKPITVDLPRFTLLGATTTAGSLPAPLRDRFGFCFQLQPYTVDELATIVLRSAKILRLSIDGVAALELAKRSRGTPRLANRLLRRARDYATARGIQVIDQGAALAAFAALEIDALGLDPVERAYLEAVAEAPVGIEALCALLGRDRTTLEGQIEPVLVQAGLIMRTARGRIATENGKRHLEVS